MRSRTNRASESCCASELVAGEPEGSERWLAGELLAYHSRAAKQQWWAYFQRKEMSQEQLLADGEVLAGLELLADRDPIAVDKSLGASDAVPAAGPQDLERATTTKIPSRGGRQSPRDRRGRAHRLGQARGRQHERPPGRRHVRRADRDAPAPGRAACASRVSVRDRTAAFPALERLLRNDLPVFSGRGSRRRRPDDGHAESCARSHAAWTRARWSSRARPGTGKTYTGARLIIDLVRAGKRVGVTALSHKAIDNLCREIEAAAVEEKFTFAGTRHGKGHHDGALIKPGEGSHYPGSEVIAATSWLFAREDMDGALDYLVIDEAGQFALADALACGTSAHNLILLGDPSQLSQVVQGTHPPGSDASALAHALAGEQTIPERARDLPGRVLPHAPGDLLVHLERVLRRAPALAPMLRRALDERRHRPQAAHRRARRQRVVTRRRKRLRSGSRSRRSWARPSPSRAASAPSSPATSSS